MSDALPARAQGGPAPDEDTHERMQELQRLAMLGNLAGGLGHDLRNLTMPVLLRLDVLSQSAEVPSSIRSDLAAIRISIDQLQQLANGLRLLATDPLDPVDDVEGTVLDQWWTDVMPLIRDTLGPKTHLVSQIDPGLPAVTIPPRKLAQVVIALAMNAHRAMEQTASPTFSFIASQQGDLVRIDVSDTGAGMDAETRSRCFEPFYTTNPRQLSTGLGLASARASVLRYGGELNLAPDGGQGTTFRLELPLHGSGDHAVSSKHHNTKIELRDPRHRALARLLLSKRGIDEWRGSATPEHHPDVVVCDAEDVAQVLADRHDWHADAETRVIAIGNRDSQITGSDVVWIPPTNLSALSEALE